MTKNEILKKVALFIEINEPLVKNKEEDLLNGKILRLHQGVLDEEINANLELVVLVALLQDI